MYYHELLESHNERRFVQVARMERATFLLLLETTTPINFVLVSNEV